METLFEHLSETLDPINSIARNAYQAGLEAGRKEKKSFVPERHNVPDHDCKRDAHGEDGCAVCDTREEQDAEEELQLKP